jgi:hypothetical protein
MSPANAEYQCFNCLAVINWKSERTKEADMHGEWVRIAPIDTEVFYGPGPHKVVDLNLSVFVDDLRAYFKRMPGPNREKYIVALECTSAPAYWYPVHDCPNWTDALRKSILQHGEENGPGILSGRVMSYKGDTFEPPDDLVQRLACHPSL